MKTNDLIESLSAGLAPAPKRLASKSIIAVVAISLPLVMALAATGLGVRSDLFHLDEPHLPMIKFIFGLMIASIGGVLLTRLATPGGEIRVHTSIAIVPFAIILALGIAAVTFTSSASLHDLIEGTGWLNCVISIPLIAAVPFAMIVFVLRRFAAPTNLVKTGAMAGLTSGGLGAIGYALHCPDDSIAFIAGWYVAAIGISAAAGALLGPRVLRW